jgi:hypothetical protein
MRRTGRADCGAWIDEQGNGGAALGVVTVDAAVDAVTPRFAEQFGRTIEECRGRSVHELVDPSAELRDTFQRLCEGEFDFCSLLVAPAEAPSTRVALHGTILRLQDATPQCALFVAHAVPGGRSERAATFSAR